MKNNDELFRDLTARLSGLDYIHPEEIPGIDLYMDQVTTFMEQHLEHSKRYPEDKVLTKTMINNYAKNNLLPPPEKKKYSREHMLTLIFIYYYKNLLSIGDIQTLLKPITDRYFQAPSGLCLTDIYEELFSLERRQLNCLEEEARKAYETASQTFAQAPENERELLQRFAFICLLGFDVYMKKHIIELLIDDIAAGEKESKDSRPKKSTRKNREEE